MGAKVNYNFGLLTLLRENEIRNVWIPLIFKMI